MYNQANKDTFGTNSSSAQRTNISDKKSIIYICMYPVAVHRSDANHPSQIYIHGCLNAGEKNLFVFCQKFMTLFYDITRKHNLIDSYVMGLLRNIREYLASETDAYAF